ncbi:MAG TPA: hypothetical protein VJC37_03155 [Planctomycetota bacterium]|nr:hypothetical protein [Planctomycetota bacterium]
MSKIAMSLVAGALGFAMLSGFALTARAQDEVENQGGSAEIRGVNEEPAPPTEAQKKGHEESRKRCQGLGCKMPKCIHNWEEYKLNLTPEQKEQVKELRDRMNKKTVGMNWCTRTAAQHRLAELRKKHEPDKNKSGIEKDRAELEKARAELKRINDGIEAAHKEYNEIFKGKILNAEQAKKFEAREKAEKEHRELCKPKHHPSCPFYRKDNVRNEGRYIQYVQDEKHLSEGIFECPGYKEAKREEHKKEHKGEHQEKDNKDGDKDNSKK